jgi:hypothetical protein
MDEEGEIPSTPIKPTNAVSYESGSETMRAKLRSREGNSPDHQLRSPNTD